jgi:hypothetical protein
MSVPSNKKAHSAKMQGAQKKMHSDYPASLDGTVNAALEAIDLAQQQLRRAGSFLVRGNLPACVGAIEASRKAIGAALDSLAGALGGA